MNRPSLRTTVAAVVTMTAIIASTHSGCASAGREPSPPEKPVLGPKPVEPAPLPPPKLVTPAEAESAWIERVSSAVAADLAAVPRIANAQYRTPVVIAARRDGKPSPELESRLAQAILADAELSRRIRVVAGSSPEAVALRAETGERATLPGGENAAITRSGESGGAGLAILLVADLSSADASGAASLAVRAEHVQSRSVVLTKRYQGF